MVARRWIAVCLVGSFAAATVASTEARAQSAGAVFGGIAGGVIGGMIAGSIAANARPRPVVVYQQRRFVRAAPRPRVARARPPGGGAPQGAAVINVSADPFAKSQGPATTAVVNGR